MYGQQQQNYCCFNESNWGKKDSIGGKFLRWVVEVGFAVFLVKFVYFFVEVMAWSATLSLVVQRVPVWWDTLEVCCWRRGRLDLFSTAFEPLLMWLGFHPCLKTKNSSVETNFKLTRMRRAVSDNESTHKKRVFRHEWNKRRN